MPLNDRYQPIRNLPSRNRTAVTIAPGPTSRQVILVSGKVRKIKANSGVKTTRVVNVQDRQKRGQTRYTLGQQLVEGSDGGANKQGKQDEKAQHHVIARAMSFWRMVARKPAEGSGAMRQMVLKASFSWVITEKRPKLAQRCR